MGDDSKRMRNLSESEEHDEDKERMEKLPKLDLLLPVTCDKFCLWAQVGGRHNTGQRLLQPVARECATHTTVVLVVSEKDAFLNLFVQRSAASSAHEYVFATFDISETNPQAQPKSPVMRHGVRGLQLEIELSQLHPQHTTTLKFCLCKDEWPVILDFEVVVIEQQPHSVPFEVYLARSGVADAHNILRHFGCKSLKDFLEYVKEDDIDSFGLTQVCKRKLKRMLTLPEAGEAADAKRPRGQD